MTIDRNSRLKANKLRDIIDAIDRLRPLPATTIRIIQVTDDPMVPASLIAEIISLDQALTFDVLKYANSIQLGYSEESSNLEVAVMRLGFKRVRALALKSFAQGPLNQKLYGYRLGADALWQHSLITATYSEKIARAVSFASPEDAYVAGLLHDIGKLILDQYVSSGYQQIVETMRSYQKHIWEVEQLLIGIDHAGVGGLMAEKWNLPSNLINTIRYHHLPAVAISHNKLASIINVANSFTPVDATSLTGLDGRFINQAAMEILGLDLPRINQLWEYLQNKPGPVES